MVTDIRFDPENILEVGGSGCGGRRTCHVGEVAFVAENHGCVVAVMITKEPQPTTLFDDDDRVVRVDMTMDSAVHCPAAQRKECEDFVRDLTKGIVGRLTWLSLAVMLI